MLHLTGYSCFRVKAVLIDVDLAVRFAIRWWWLIFEGSSFRRLRSSILDLWDRSLPIAL